MYIYEHTQIQYLLISEQDLWADEFGGVVVCLITKRDCFVMVLLCTVFSLLMGSKGKPTLYNILHLHIYLNQVR